MTVSSSTNSVILSANGTAHSFAFTFKIFAAADLQVIVRSTAGVETVKTLNSHYIIADSSVGNANGGNVLFKFNTSVSSDAHYSTTDYRPANNEKVILRRAQPQTQGLDLVANDPFPAESFEESLDKLTFMVQDVQEAVDRSFKFSRSNTLDSSGSSIASSYSEIEENTTSRANKVLSFDSTGVPIATQEIGTLKGNWAASTVYQERDIVKDTSNNNIYIVNEAHTSSGSQPLSTNGNASKYTVIIDTGANVTLTASGAITGGSLVADNITIDGNTITTTDTNGNLIVTPNGSGVVHFDGSLEVEGNDSSTSNTVTISPSSTGGDDIFLTGSNPWVAFYDDSTSSVPRYGGGTVGFYGKNASGSYIQVGAVEGYQSDATDGSVDGGIRITGASNNSQTAAILVNGADVTISGDLTVSGDDITMGTNTAGYLLVADGTNYNPVAVSGDVTMASSGAVTIASGAVENAMLAGSIADSKLSTITTADKVSGAAIQVDGATDGTSITVADADKILIDDGGTTKYINASQLNTYISASASAVAADNITAGDAAINLTTTSGNITIDAQANNSDIIFKGTDGSADTTFLTISGADAGAATFNSTVTATGFVVGSTALNEYIADTVGAMVSSNTETNITVTYEDGDNTLDFVIGTLNQDTTGTADNFTVTANNSANETVYPVFVDGATGSQGAETDTGLTYNPSTGLLTSTGFSGNLTGTLQTAAQTNITSVGALDGGSITSGFGNINNGSSTITTTGAITGGSLTADGITIDGQAINTDSGDLTISAPHASADIVLDAGDNIILDTDGGNILFKDGGTEFLEFEQDGGGCTIRVDAANTDLKFVGNDSDGSGTITALTLDMSEAGAATFNSTVTATGFTGALTGNASTATLASTVTVSDSTANTFFPVVFHDESNALLDDTGALRYNPSTGELFIPKLGADDVYIGTTSSLMSYDSSSTKLTVYDATGSAQSGYLELGANATVNGYNAGAIQFINNNNADGSDTDAADTKCVGQIRTTIVTSDSNSGDDSGGTMEFYTKPEAGALAQRMTISSSGVVAITGDASITSGTNAQVTINDAISEVGTGNIAFQAVNSAGSALKPMGFRAEDIRFATGSTERMRVHNSGVVSFNNGIELGSGLDATAANTLDDYEEGSFTPTGNNITLSTAEGRYTKIGNVVRIGMYLVFPSTSDTNDAFIGSLPFTCTNLQSARSGLVIAWHNVSSSNGLSILTTSNATTALFYLSNTARTNANMSSASVYVGGTYITDS